MSHPTTPPPLPHTHTPPQKKKQKISGEILRRFFVGDFLRRISGVFAPEIVEEFLSNIIVYRTYPFYMHGN